MSKLPAFQFYPSDWRTDNGVQSCGYFERGVWLEILCLMHESEQRGKLLLNGKPMPEDALARLLGLDKQILNRTIATLLDYGVADLDEQGALMSRRMVRDESQRSFQREAGKRGGNPSLTKNYNKPGFVYAVQRSSDGWIKIGISENPTKRLYRLRYLTKGDSLEMLGFVHVADMGKEEARLHRQFSHCEHSGEWFAIAGEDLDALRFALKGQSKGKGKEQGKEQVKGNQTPSSSSSISEEKESDSYESPKKRGTRIPDPFLLTFEMRQYAKDRRPDVDVALETEKFCNFWRAKTGRDATKLDWTATWRNWILNAKTTGGGNENTRRDRPSSADNIREQDLSEFDGLDPVREFSVA